MPGGGCSASHPSPGGPGQGVQATTRPAGCSAAPSPHGEQKGCWADGHAWGALGGVPGQRLCPTVNGAGHETTSPPPAPTEDGPGARRHPAPPAHLLHPQHTPSKPNTPPAYPVHPQHPRAAPCRVRCRSWQRAQPRALLQVPPPGPGSRLLEPRGPQEVRGEPGCGGSLPRDSPPGGAGCGMRAAAGGARAPANPARGARTQPAPSLSPPGPCRAAGGAPRG